ncbi:MAG: hypothetical protein LBT32_07800 [Peptococcaceae bacterium]|jgi:hypothetical protein|nr:hypothetical protein [Peptococcaceae bacterium]
MKEKNQNRRTAITGMLIFLMLLSGCGISQTAAAPPDEPAGEFTAIIMNFIHREYPEIGEVNSLRIVLNEDIGISNLIQYIAQTRNQAYMGVLVIDKEEKLAQDMEILTAGNAETYSIGSGDKLLSGPIEELRAALEEVRCHSDILTPWERDKNYGFGIEGTMASLYETLNEDEEKIPFHYIGGFVNDQRIRALELIWAEDHSLTELMLNENQDYFGYVKFDLYSGELESITAKDSQGNPLYVYPPFPPQEL